MPDIEFGPNKEKHYYISSEKHQKNASFNPHKTRWIIDCDEEYKLFCTADEYESNGTHHPWKSENNLHAFKDGCRTIIGDKNNKIATFVDKNNTGTWHGYPDSKPKISTALIKFWAEEKLIDNSIRTKLNKRLI